MEKHPPKGRMFVVSWLRPIVLERRICVGVIGRVFPQPY